MYLIIYFELILIKFGIVYFYGSEFKLLKLWVKIF